MRWWLSQRKTPPETSAHARFHTSTTNNITEALALLAALRLAARAEDDLIAIVVDSLNVYSWALGVGGCSSEEASVTGTANIAPEYKITRDQLD